MFEHPRSAGDVVDAFARPEALEGLAGVAVFGEVDVERLAPGLAAHFAGDGDFGLARFVVATHEGDRFGAEEVGELDRGDGAAVDAVDGDFDVGEKRVLEPVGEVFGDHFGIGVEGDDGGIAAAFHGHGVDEEPVDAVTDAEHEHAGVAGAALDEVENFVFVAHVAVGVKQNDAESVGIGLGHLVGHFNGGQEAGSAVGGDLVEEAVGRPSVLGGVGHRFRPEFSRLVAERDDVEVILRAQRCDEVFGELDGLFDGGTRFGCRTGP